MAILPGNGPTVCHLKGKGADAACCPTFQAAAGMPRWDAGDVASSTSWLGVCVKRGHQVWVQSPATTRMMLFKNEGWVHLFRAAGMAPAEDCRGIVHGLHLSSIVLNTRPSDRISVKIVEGVDELLAATKALATFHFGKGR